MKVTFGNAYRAIRSLCFFELFLFGLANLAIDSQIDAIPCTRSQYPRYLRQFRFRDVELPNYF